MKLKNLHVLLIEDIAPMRELTSAVLKAQGIGTVSYAPDGKKGYEVFCQHQPDLIITDWHMPTMDGLELTKLIRTNPHSPDRTVPIIMMSGFNSPDKISAARNSGITEFLLKPFTAKDISKRIVNTIKAPRDFIITPSYAGPDRRRKEDMGANSQGKNSRVNPNGYTQKFKASTLLQAKVGLGLVPEDGILKSQQILDKNTIDFVPIAENFMKQLIEGLDGSRHQENRNRRIIENLVNPIMQIKANARIFKFDMLGDLSGTMLNFLEGLNELDNDAFQIVEAHCKTIALIINTNMRGDGGNVGQTFVSELEAVCKRYTQSRIHRQKEALQKIISD
jgi:two-component system chemotaxis response regulator CheY